MSNEQDQLNDFVRRLPELLRARMPALFDSSELEEKGSSEVLLWLNRGSDDEVLVTSADSELTIAFGETHWHINTSSHPQDLVQMQEECFKDLQDLLAGRIVSYSLWAGETALMGGQQRSDEAPITLPAPAHPRADKRIIKAYRQARRCEVLAKP